MRLYITLSFYLLSRVHRSIPAAGVAVTRQRLWPRPSQPSCSGQHAAAGTSPLDHYLFNELVDIFRGCLWMDAYSLTLTSYQINYHNVFVKVFNSFSLCFTHIQHNLIFKINIPDVVIPRLAYSKNLMYFYTKLCVLESPGVIASDILIYKWK